MNTALPFGPGALLVMGLYLVSLLGIGAYAYKQRKADTLSDFFSVVGKWGWRCCFSHCTPPSTAVTR